MSKTRYAKLQVICFVGATAYTTIIDKLETDEDFNGNNGVDYLSYEARKKGYSSNFEYHWREAFFNKKTNKKVGEERYNLIFKDFFKRLKGSDDSYYRNIEFVLTNINGVLGHYVLSVMYETEF